MKSKIRAITYGGILSAVILLSTYIIKFPIPGGYGYVNFGDGAIFATSIVLGPFAAICAAIGSVLADLLAGFPHYMIPTLIIKGLMGFISGTVFSKKPDLKWGWQLLLFAVCEAIMVGGYFVAEIIMYGLAAASGSLIFNTLQGLAGIATGLAIAPLARKIKI
ncbi:MAG: ECF transporter S component [Clostridia bacterium]|nr:ECF transporter S component [Clostridia bacterium]